MYCLSRISRGQHFLLLSPGRMEAGTPRESRISRGHFFFLLGTFRICPIAPPLYTRGSGASLNSVGGLWGKGGAAYPKTVGIRQYPCPVFVGARGAKCGAKPKILPHKGGQGVGQKRACPVVCPALGAGGETWTF